VLRDSRRRRALAFADVLALVLAYGLVWLVDPPPGADVPSRAWMLGILPLWVLINKLLGLYDRDANVIQKSTLDEFPRLVQSILLGASMLFLVAPLFPGVELGREQTVLFVAAALPALPALRSLTRWALARHEAPERCLIVGSGEVARSLATRLGTHSGSRLEIVGFMDEHRPGMDAEPDGDVPLVGDLLDFDSICRDLEVERVLIAFSSHSHEALIGIVAQCKALALKVTVLPRLFEAVGEVEVDQVQGMTLLGLGGLSRTRSSLALKRALDLVGAGTGLLVLSPLLLAIALGVRLTSSGPALFRQRRIGRGDQPFELLKFRTMQHDAEELKPTFAHLNEAAHPMFKIRNDPRVTPFGRFLRRHSLDELPQLWNVVRGEMSLVGPRPLIADEDASVLGRQRARLELTPGITGPWQVMGRTRIPFNEMVKLDYLYVAEWSLWNDVKLLVRTAAVVLRGEGI